MPRFLKSGVPIIGVASAAKKASGFGGGVDPVADFTLVGEATVSGAPSTTMQITGISSTADKRYYAVALVDYSGGATIAYMAANGVTSYLIGYERSGGTDLGGTTESGFGRAQVSGANQSLLFATFDVSLSVLAATHQHMTNSASSSRCSYGASVSTGVASITSVEVTATTANGLGIGSWLKVYEVVA